MIVVMSTYPEIIDLMLYSITKCSPGWLVPRVRHPFHRLYYIYSGEAFYESMEEAFHLEKNTLYLFPASREYNIIN